MLADRAEIEAGLGGPGRGEKNVPRRLEPEVSCYPRGKMLPNRHRDQLAPGRAAEVSELTPASATLVAPLAAEIVCISL